MNSDKPQLVDTGRGLTIYYNNKYLYSKYNPKKSVDKYIDNIIWNDSTIYLVPSPLLEYGIKKIKHLLPTNSKLLFIEADIDLYNISDKKNIIHITNSFDLLEISNNIDFSKFRKCELLKLNGGYELNKDLYDRFYRVSLNQLQNYWRNRLTLTKMGQLWIKNTLSNLKSINKSTELTNLHTTKPVVVIGAGESVESVLSIIKQYRKSIYLLCVDTALQILLETEIKPDAVLALEAQYYNLPDFYGAKNLEIDLIYDLSSYPGVVRTLNGKKYYTLTNFSDSKLIKKIIDSGLISKTLPPMGSVGITALYTALQITNNNIFICGLDFSYKLGKTHSRGTPYHASSLINWDRLNPGYTIANCLKRPLVKKINKIGLLENSDTILYDYSLQARELLYNCNRIFDITQAGMDLGIPLLNKDELENYIIKETNSYNSYTKSARKDGNDLYNNELNQLNIGIKALRSIIDKKSSIDESIHIINKLDYFFEHYPEEKPLEQLNSSNVERFYYTLMRFKRLLTGSM